VEEREAFRGLKLRGIIEPPVLPVSTLAALMYLSYAAIVAFLSLFTRDLGFAGSASWFFLAYAAIALLSRPLVGRLFDRRGALPIIFPSLAVLVLGFVTLSQMNGFALLILSALLVGLGQGAIQAASLAVVAKITPAHRKGIGTTTYYLMADVGYSLGPILSGVLLGFSGFRGLYLIMGGVIACTMGFCYWQRRNLSGRPQE
jgi:MFS family permease